MPSRSEVIKLGPAQVQSIPSHQEHLTGIELELSAHVEHRRLLRPTAASCPTFNAKHGKKIANVNDEEYKK